MRAAPMIMPGRLKSVSFVRRQFEPVSPYGQIHSFCSAAFVMLRFFHPAPPLRFITFMLTPQYKERFKNM